MLDIGQNASAPSKLDMSLDDIIKLNRKEARKAQYSVPRGGRRFIAKNRKVRSFNTSVGRARIKKLKQNRTLKSVLQRKQFTRQSNQNNRSTALAVLRRARQTATAAAKAAADAAALIELGHSNRQRIFDERRGVQLPGVAYERRGQRNLSKRVNRFRRVSDFNVSNSFVRHRLNEKNRSYQKNQRFRRRSDNIGLSFQRLKSRFSTGSYNDFRSTNNIRFDRNIRSANLQQSTRSNNAEYLAQARALIRAQTEQTRGFRFHPRNNRYRNRNNARGRGINYYAKFWENHQ